MIKSILFDPGQTLEKMDREQPEGRVTERYFNGKHAFALLIKIQAGTPFMLVASVIREDLFWFYQLEGSSTIRPEHTDLHSRSLYLQAKTYAPFFASRGKYVLQVPSGRHYFLILVAQLDWMKRYTGRRFSAIGDLIQSSGPGFRIGDTQRIGVRHLRCLSALQRMAYRPGFRQDISLYARLADLFDYYTEEAGCQKALHARDTSAAVLSEISRYLRGEVTRGNVPTTGELAESFGLHERTLTRQFKRRFGLTPSQYTHQLRMDEALWLLREEKLPPTQVAYQLGYDHFRTFARAFLRYYGYSPGSANREPG